MKRGDVLHGYEIVSEPSNKGAGRCVWAFARKNGKDYFIKKYLDPKRPGPSAGEEKRRRLTAECAEFERRHHAVASMLRPDAVGAGNLVLALDFFHEGSSYYKVTEKITEAEPAIPLEPEQTHVLLRTLAISLRLLHDIGVVHGDLKPDNILIQRRTPAPSFHVAKLIDFDDAYVAGDPPARDVVGGDLLFGAPEWCRYVQGDPSVGGSQLTTKADMFALGLVAHYYLTGALPGFGSGYGSPADAVSSGQTLDPDRRLTDKVADLVRSLTARDPDRRPGVDQFLAVVASADSCRLAAGGRPSTPRSAGSDRRFEARPDGTVTGVPGRTSRIRTSVGHDGASRHTGGPPASAPPAATPPPSVTPPTAGLPHDSRPRPRSRLRINL